MADSMLEPRLVVDNAAHAIEFYKAVFNAEEVSRFADESGRVGHAQLSIAGATFNLKDEGDGDPSATSLGGTPVLLCLTVPDVDAVAELMVAGGATVVYPIDDGPLGRGGRLRDPFGHVWMISQS